MNQKPREKWDVFIAGGGLAGLIAAATFGDAGFSVLLADPAIPASKGVDQRSTALLRPARDLLTRVGLWDELVSQATPMQSLRVVDTAGTPSEVRASRDFGAADADGPLGWNFLNRNLHSALLDHLERQSGVELRFGTGIADLLTRTQAAIVTLSDGSRIDAKLVIGADGRTSRVAELAGIEMKTVRYGQTSLAFTATHFVAHDNVSTEIYHEGGPFTMVPLPDHNNLPASAIVWMNPSQKAKQLAALPVPEFEAAMNERSAGLFGPMQLASPIGQFPIISQKARHLCGERTVLVAEAAHVLPPIGAQGLNTSLNDIAVLLDLAVVDRENLGSATMLTSYARRRAPDIAARVGIIDTFNRVTRSPSSSAQALRLAGLKAVHDITPLRDFIMRAGMGPL